MYLCKNEKITPYCDWKKPKPASFLFSSEYVTPPIYFAKTVALKHLTILFNLLFCSICFSQTKRGYSQDLISLFTESV